MNVRLERGSDIKEILPNGQVIEYKKYEDKIESFKSILENEGYKIIKKSKIVCNLSEFELILEDENKNILQKLNSRIFLLISYNNLTVIKIAHGDTLQLEGLRINKVIDLILDVLLNKIEDIKSSPLNDLITKIYDENNSDLELMYMIDSYKSSKIIKKMQED